MSVLSCSRYGCENIMSDYLSYNYGYICNECIEELKSKPFIDIKEFMDSPKSLNSVNNTFLWNEIVDNEFKFI